MVESMRMTPKRPSRPWPASPVDYFVAKIMLYATDPRHGRYMTAKEFKAALSELIEELDTLRQDIPD